MNARFLNLLVRAHDATRRAFFHATALLPPYRPTRWAEPGLGAAAKALRRLYESPDLRRQLGTAARAFIADHFSQANFKKSIVAFLDAPASST